MVQGSREFLGDLKMFSCKNEKKILSLMTTMRQLPPQYGVQFIIIMLSSLDYVHVIQKLGNVLKYINKINVFTFSKTNQLTNTSAYSEYTSTKRGENSHYCTDFCIQ
jgi:hypothetical protein